MPKKKNKNKNAVKSGALESVAVTASNRDPDAAGVSPAGDVTGTDSPFKGSDEIMQDSSSDYSVKLSAEEYSAKLSIEQEADGSCLLSGSQTPEGDEEAEAMPVVERIAGDKAELDGGLIAQAGDEPCAIEKAVMFDEEGRVSVQMGGDCAEEDNMQDYDDDDNGPELVELMSEVNTTLTDHIMDDRLLQLGLGNNSTEIKQEQTSNCKNLIPDNGDIPEDGWMLYQTADGHDYYYNHRTGESQWASEEHSSYSQEYEQYEQYEQSTNTHVHNNYIGRQYRQTGYHHAQDSDGQAPPAQRQQFYNPSLIRNSHPAADAYYSPTPAQRAPAVTFYKVPPQAKSTYGGTIQPQEQEKYDLGDYATERQAWDNDGSVCNRIADYDQEFPLYDEEAGYMNSRDEGNYASDEDDNDFDEKFAAFLQSSAGQRALEEEKSRLERKSARIAKKKLKEEARLVWLASRGKDKESDDDMGTEQFNRDRRLSANLSQRSHRGEKRRSHWEVDEAEAGMSYFSGQDTGSNSSVVSTGTTSTDDDDVSSDDSDVETMLSPTIPLQFTSSNAAIETLRPIQLFLYRFAEVGLEVTKEISGTIWAHTRVAAQQVIETTANIALGYFTTSFEIIQRRGGETYNMLNTAIIEFVEADMEHPIHNSSTSSEIGTAIDINGQLLANPCSIGSILAENSAVKTGSSDLNANDIEVVILAGEAVHGSSASGY